MKEIKRCPFCGERANIFISNNDNIFIPMEEMKKENYHSVRCVSCFCGTGLYRDLNRAIEAWNRRYKNE